MRLFDKKNKRSCWKNKYILQERQWTYRILIIPSLSLPFSLFHSLPLFLSLTPFLSLSLSPSLCLSLSLSHLPLPTVESFRSSRKLSRATKLLVRVLFACLNRNTDKGQITFWPRRRHEPQAEN